MGRTKPNKPNKPSKSPNKRKEEDDEQDPSINVTPQPVTARKDTTETEKSDTPEMKSYRTNTQIKNIYKDNSSMNKHMDKLNRERKLKGLQALYREDDLLTTMNTQGNNISKPGMRQESSPTQEDQKMAAQDSDASSPYSMNRNEIENRTRDDTKMERMFAALAENTKLQMKQQEERHAKETADKSIRHTI
jgi:hypothetical protein